MRCLHYRAWEGPYAVDEHNKSFVSHICGNQKLCDKFSKVPKGANLYNKNVRTESHVECC